IQPARNAEGRVLPALAFDEETVERFAGREPVQPAGAALLRLAWAHRDVLLSSSRGPTGDGSSPSHGR
ncbi:MAG TPA: hypothetical protein VKU39_00835, partial [Streptosporangiaceae bacterium]|nr:hypothetical protein [Streptosporangiaceae bacterium]